MIFFFILFCLFHNFLCRTWNIIIIIKTIYVTFKRKWLWTTTTKTVEEFISVYKPFLRVRCCAVSFQGIPTADLGGLSLQIPPAPLPPLPFSPWPCFWFHWENWNSKETSPAPPATASPPRCVCAPVPTVPPPVTQNSPVRWRSASTHALWRGSPLPCSRTLPQQFFPSAPHHQFSLVSDYPISI